MSRMLALFESGFAVAERLARIGRKREALQNYRSLLALCPTADDELRVHKAAAALAVQSERFHLARKHLRRAAKLAPNDSELQRDLGIAWERDPFGCDRRAARRFRKATQLNANDPKSKAALGRAMVRIREVRSGIKVLRTAAERAPTDPEVLEIVADGLREAGESEIAFELLTKARFLAPKLRAIEELWSRARYDLASQQQRVQRTESKPRSTAVLPFLKLVHSDSSQAERVRTDHPTTPRPHFARLRTFRADLG